MPTITPHDWQQADVNTLSQHDYTGLLNIQPGGGKTVLALAAAQQSGADSVLILGPAVTFRSAWSKDAAGLGIEHEVRLVGNGTKAQKQAKSDLVWGRPGYYFATPQFFTRDDSVGDWSGDMLIADEGHLLNNAKSAGQKRFSGYDIRKDDPISRRFDSRLFLSGTPVRNSFERAWATMRFLWPERDGQGDIAYFNYYAWLNERMTYEDIVTGFEWKVVPKNWFNPDGSVWLPEGVEHKKMIDGRLHYGEVKKTKKWLAEMYPGRLFNEAPCVIQHFRRQRCCDFHPNGFLPFGEPTRIEKTLDLLPAQKRAIKDLETQMLAWVDDNPLVTDLSITQKQRIRQLCLGVPKVETITVEDADGIETEKSQVTFEDADRSPFADQLLDDLEKIPDECAVVFLESQGFARVLTERLNREGVPTFEYSGKTRATRDADLAAFGTKFRVAVVVLSAGGTGLDGIQKVTKNEFWLETSVDGTVNEQGEARADRAGAIGQVVRTVYLDSEGYAAGRINEDIARRLALRKSTTRRGA